MIHPADPENEHQALAWRTWKEILPFLEKEHSGQYALVHDAEVIGFFPTLREALVLGLEKFPPSTFLVRGVATPPVPDLPPAMTYVWPEIPPKPESYFRPRVEDPPADTPPEGVAVTVPDVAPGPAAAGGATEPSPSAS